MRTLTFHQSSDRFVGEVIRMTGGFPIKVRSLTLALFLVSLPLVALGRPITQQHAGVVAAHYLQMLPLGEGTYRFLPVQDDLPPGSDIIGDPGEQGASPAQPPGSIVDPSGRILAYVFELSPQGFLVVSADTRLIPLIAYSVECSFPWSERADNGLLNVLRFDLRRVWTQ
jgi:hypothetical protein